MAAWRAAAVRWRGTPPAAGVVLRTALSCEVMFAACSITDVEVMFAAGGYVFGGGLSHATQN